MCGSIRISTSTTEAIDFGIAYADSFKPHRYDWMEDNDAFKERVKDWKESRRERAVEFINYYVPVTLRAGALKLLAKRKDEELLTTLDYHDDVVT